jgi:hypothetical protein
MPWEKIGDCGLLRWPSDREWTLAELRMGIEYLARVCGEVPEGCELDIMWQEFDAGNAGEITECPSVGLAWDDTEIEDAPWDYIDRCEAALSIFDEAVNWAAIHPDAVNEQIRENEAADDAERALDGDASDERETESS